MRQWSVMISALALSTCSLLTGHTGGRAYAASGQWVSVGNLSVARVNGRAITLQDGRVLVAGGYTNHGVAASDVYDPSTNSWTQTGSLAPGRGSLTGTLLLDGDVLVTGGYVPLETNQADIYDPSLGTWKTVAGMNEVRNRHSAVLLADGRVLVEGGWRFGCMTASAELYDPASRTWAPTGSMTTAHADDVAIRLRDGRVLVAGGDQDCPSQAFASAELYDPQTGTWSPTGSMNVPRAHASAALLQDGRVLVAGGNNFSGGLSSAEIYDPSSGTWSLTGSMQYARFFSAGVGAVTLHDGHVLVAGGDGTPGTSEEYDPSTGTWSVPVAMIVPHNNGMLALLHDGRVLIASGGDPFDPSGFTTDAEIYTPASLDTTPPVIVPHVGGALGSNGWYTDDVAVSWDVSDPESAITTSSGCDSTTITSDTNGTTLTCTATSTGGTSSQSVTIKRDATPPSITCASADLLWHPANVDLACSAQDQVSGLASPDDGSFSLSTSVASGSEDRNASTDSRQVCDLAGNCVTAGPIFGNMIDREPPTLKSCDSPEGQWHATNVSLTCTYTDGGSGPASQTISLSTTVAAGSEDGNASATTASQVCDAAGNCVTPAPIPGNKIDRKAPALQSCDAPDGLWHASNVTLGCTYTDGGAGPASQTVSLTTSVPSGSEDANAAATATSQACDAVGNCAPSPTSISGNKVDRKAPSINITTPAATTYTLGQAVLGGYSCADGGSGVASCIGPVASGSPIDTNSVGARSFTVAAQDTVGNNSSQSVAYAVTYNICQLSGGAKPKNSRVDVQVVLCDASGKDVSSPSIALTVTGVTPSGGIAQPSGTFTYDKTLGSTGGYKYTLDVKSYPAGSYALQFTASGDPVVHQASFSVK